MKLHHLVGLVAGLPLVTAQTAFSTASGSASNTIGNSFAAETTGAVPSTFAAPSNVPTSEACAVVSSVLASQSGAAELVVDAELANECAQSAPIVEEDALLLVDGIMAALQFQSDLELLKNPPEGYLLAGVDLIGELQQVRDQVSSGAFTSELDFEKNVTAVLGKAQDGHLSFMLDGMGMFIYHRQFDLVSVSSDGKEKPELYLYDELLAYLEGTAAAPSVVTEVNGQDLVQFLQNEGQNVSYGGFQDPDALYNVELYQRNNAGSPLAGYFALSLTYKGANTTLTFADGSTQTLANYAVWNSNYPFAGLSDGASFYNICCNATAKAAYVSGGSSGSATETIRKNLENVDKSNMRVDRHRVANILERDSNDMLHRRQSPSSSAAASGTTATALPGYPSPIAISSDGALSGYFLDESGFEDTAVLVLQAMSEGDPVSFLDEMTVFLDACRKASKTRLVLDIQGNPGGSVATGYGIFKQLFPDIWPYGAATLRAQEGFETLGTFYTNFTAQLYAEQPDNVTLLSSNDYYMQYNAKAWLNDSGDYFNSFPELYGPVDNGVDNYTNLLRWDLNNTNFAIGAGGLVIPGFGNDTALSPSPFTSDNIIILSNGLCSSTCTILTHFLKYQGKVKSIAMGGRPTTSAMQSVGGTKGSQVYQYLLLYRDVYLADQDATTLGYYDQVDAIAASSTLSNILNNGSYIVLRGRSAGVLPAAKTDFQFNWQNNIAEEDTSYTPAQFVYEAADCHLWYQPQHMGNISTLWATAAAQAFGINGTDVFSLCVEGSTNQSSSLSGNATLYNDGNPTNVTDFQPEQFDTDGSSSGSGGNGNGAGHLTMSTVAVVGAISMAMLML